MLLKKITKNQKQQGFNLIELLLIIAVLIVLVLISVWALAGQRTRARDAKRISDIRQIRTALELYKINEGEYPLVANALVLGSAQAAKLCSNAEGGLVSSQTACLVDTTYMSVMPGDPLAGQKYLFTSQADGYNLQFTTEKDTILGSAGFYFGHASGVDARQGNY